MKVLFLQRDPFVKLGIATLSAVLKENNHQCELLVENLEKDVFRKIIDIDPDIIAFSITTNEFSWLGEIGRNIRKRFKKTIVCGGPHPTFYPDVIREEYLDAICIGEGEGAILDLVNALEKKQDVTDIKNLITKKKGLICQNELRPLIGDLDCIPFLDRAIYDKYTFFKKQRNGYILTGRGCPSQCSFCFNKFYNKIYAGKGKIVRKRKAAEIIKEIKKIIKEAKNINYINFYDDTFILLEDWLTEFLDNYKREINLPFSCTARADMVKESIIKKLKGANCFSIRMGVESGDDHLRNVVLKKGITYEQIIESTGLIKKYGIRLQVFNMLGTPGETLDTAFKTFELNKKIYPHHPWCSLLQPYPGTEIFEYAVKENFLENNPDFKNFDNSIFMSTPIKIKERREINNLQKIFTISVLLRLPQNLVRILIKLPLGKLYDLVFKVNYALGIARIDNLSLMQVAKIGLASRNFFKKR